jgi:hypothetical protein
VLPFRVLPRTVSSYPSRRSTPNCRCFNELQPLASLFAVPVLYFQRLAASFPKTPGVGGTLHNSPFGISKLRPLFSHYVSPTYPHRRRLALRFSFFVSRFRFYPPFVFITLRIAFPVCPPDAWRATLSFHNHPHCPGVSPSGCATIPTFRHSDSFRYNRRRSVCAVAAAKAQPGRPLGSRYIQTRCHDARSKNA